MLAHTISFLALYIRLAQSAAMPSPRCSKPNFPISTHLIPLYPPFSLVNGLFSADITVGSQALRAGLDTGSSDTWFLAQNTNCTEEGTLQPIAPDQCGFSGPRYIPDNTFEQIPDVNFNQSYGNGELVAGPLGYSKLIFGGITIPKQEIGSATYASLGGNSAGNISGIVGLAFPNGTNAYPGTDPTKDTLCAYTTDSTSCGPIPYSPFLTTVFMSNLSAPIFSFALSRSTNHGGTMAIGGIPHPHKPDINATISGSSLTATTPIEPFGNSTGLLIYATTASGFHYPNSVPGAGQGQYIIDTGTYPNILPRSEADKVNALFAPPATFNSTGGYYIVLCNATPPPFGVEFDGTVFYHNTQDMILPVPGESQLCFSAIQSSLTAVFLPILGATFLKNVLAVFDVGASEMTSMAGCTMKSSVTRHVLALFGR